MIFEHLIQYWNSLTIYQFLEYLGAFIGFFYLYYQYKADPKLWIYGLFMSILYIIVFFHAKVFFWAAINVYYLVIQVYSIFNWRKVNSSDDTPTILKRFPVNKIWILIVIISVLSFILSLVAIRFLESAIPIPEAISTSLSLVAMYLLSKKYLEHWLIWIVVDLFYLVYNIVLGLYPTFFLYLVYTIVAVMGYFKWKQLYHNQMSTVSSK